MCLPLDWQDDTLAFMSATSVSVSWERERGEKREKGGDIERRRERGDEKRERCIEVYVYIHRSVYLELLNLIPHSVQVSAHRRQQGQV